MRVVFLFYRLKRREDEDLTIKHLARSCSVLPSAPHVRTVPIYSPDTTLECSQALRAAAVWEPTWILLGPFWRQNAFFLSWITIRLDRGIKLDGWHARIHGIRSLEVDPLYFSNYIYWNSGVRKQCQARMPVQFKERERCRVENKVKVGAAGNGWLLMSPNKAYGT